MFLVTNDKQFNALLPIITFIYIINAYISYKYVCTHKHTHTHTLTRTHVVVRWWYGGGTHLTLRRCCFAGQTGENNIFKRQTMIEDLATEQIPYACLGGGHKSH